MSIVEETRIALLELFPELAAAEAEIRAALQAEAEEKAAAEAAAAENIDEEMESALAEMESMELVADAAAESAEDGGEEEAPAEEAPAKPEPEEPEEEGPRENGVMLTDHAARGTDIDVLCDPEQVVEAAKIMDEAGFFLEAITGVDWIKEEKIEVVYDYNQYGPDQCRVAVRTFLPRAEPEVPTISPRRSPAGPCSRTFWWKGAPDNLPPMSLCRP